MAIILRASPDPRRGRTLFEAPADDALERRRNVALGDRQMGRVFFQDRGNRVGGRHTGKRALSRKHFVEDHAERKNVCAARDMFVGPDYIVDLTPFLRYRLDLSGDRLRACCG